jgi:hypothetical protein
MAKVDAEAFVKKSPFERLKALLSTPIAAAQLVIALVAVLGGFVSMTDSISRLISKATDTFSLAHEKTDRIRDAQDQLTEALQNLRTAREELRKSHSDAALVDVVTSRVELNVSSALRSLDEVNRRKQGWDLGLVSTAYADTPSTGAALPIDAKRWLLVGIMGVLAAAFIFSIVAIFRTKDPQVLQFSFDTVKTLMGFFIGVATTLIGTT